MVSMSFLSFFFLSLGVIKRRNELHLLHIDHEARALSFISVTINEEIYQKISISTCNW